MIDKIFASISRRMRLSSLGENPLFLLKAIGSNQTCTSAFLFEYEHASAHDNQSYRRIHGRGLQYSLPWASVFLIRKDLTLWQLSVSDHARQKRNRAGHGFVSHYNSRPKHSTIRSAAFPSHSGGIAPFFHCPAINRASAVGSLLGSVPISSLV